MKGQTVKEEGPGWMATGCDGCSGCGMMGVWQMMHSPMSM